MKKELENSFLEFEFQMFETFGIKPYELEQMDLFTLSGWLQMKKKNILKLQQQKIFEMMKNGNTRNKSKISSR